MTAVFTDETGLEAIASLLNGTGCFSAVMTGENPPEQAARTTSWPSAWIREKGWVENLAMDPDQLVRIVAYTIDLTTAPTPSKTVQAALLELAAVVQNRLSQVSLGPTCLPVYSQLGNANLDPKIQASYPAQTAQLTGQFAYFVGLMNQRGQDQYIPKPSSYYNGSYFSGNYFGGIYS